MPPTQQNSNRPGANNPEQPKHQEPLPQSCCPDDIHFNRSPIKGLTYQESLLKSGQIFQPRNKRWTQCASITKYHPKRAQNRKGRSEISVYIGSFRRNHQCSGTPPWCDCTLYNERLYTVQSCCKGSKKAISFCGDYPIGCRYYNSNHAL